MVSLYYIIILFSLYVDGFSDQLRKRTVTESQIVRANMQELKSPSEVMNVCSILVINWKRFKVLRMSVPQTGLPF